jgi:hypothetical protein
VHTSYVAPEPAGSSPYVQELSIGPCFEPIGFRLHNPANLPKIHSNPILPSTPWSFKWSHCATSSILLLLHLCLVQIFSSEPCSQTPSFLNVRDQVPRPYKTTGRIMVLYILTFTFLDSRREEEDSGLNDSKHSRNLVCS